MPTLDGDAMMAYVNSFPVWAAVRLGARRLGRAGTDQSSCCCAIARHIRCSAQSLLGALVGVGYQLANPGGDHRNQPGRQRFTALHHHRHRARPVRLCPRDEVQGRAEIGFIAAD